MATEYGKVIARNLKKIAYEHNKSQADIARDLHLNQATVSSWMLGTRIPRMDKVDLLCNYFNCKRSDIMEENPEDFNDYYMDADVRDLAEFLHKNPKYKVLFDSFRKVKPEDIDFIKQMIDRVSDNE